MSNKTATIDPVPCRCGSQPYTVGSFSLGFDVVCVRCENRATGGTEEAAIIAWNRRSSVQEAAPATAADGLTETLVSAIMKAHDASSLVDPEWVDARKCAEAVASGIVHCLSAARAVAPAGVPEGSPDDIRAAGWAVAVHNDYRLHGQPHTFWLFTKGDRAVKGEGLTDAEALNAVRHSIGLFSAAPSAGEAK